MAIRSRMVKRRMQAAKWLRGAVQTHGREPAKVLEERMAAVLEEGERPPDVAHFIDVLSRLLVYEAEELERFDDTRWTSTGSARSARRLDRDPAVAELRQMIVDLRKCLTGMYGTRKANDLLDIRGRTPRGIEDLLFYGRFLALSLSRLELPESKLDLGASPRTWAKKMKPLVERLDRHFKEVRSRNWQRDVAVDARNDNLGEFDGTYGPVLRLIECVYLLGGEARKGRRLRLRFRRRLVNRWAAMAAGSVAGVAARAASSCVAVARTAGRRLGRLARGVGRWLGAGRG